MQCIDADCNHAQETNKPQKYKWYENNQKLKKIENKNIKYTKKIAVLWKHRAKI